MVVSAPPGRLRSELDHPLRAEVETGEALLAIPVPHREPLLEGDVPDRADVRTDTAGCATVLGVTFIVLFIHQKWNKAELLWEREFFFWILNCEDAFCILAHAMLDAFFCPITLTREFDINNIRINKPFKGYT